MDGESTLRYIHYALMVAIMLWIMASCHKEGLWGNALLFFNWCLAAALTWKLWLPAVVLVNEQFELTDRYAIAAASMALLWVPFLVILTLLRMATDALSRVKVTFHPIADTIGSIFFTFLLFVGVSLLFGGYVAPYLHFGIEPWWMVNGSYE